MEFGSTRIKAVLVDPAGQSARIRQPRLGEPPGKSDLDLQPEADIREGFAGLLCGTETGCTGKIRRDADTAVAAMGFQRNDAWIHGI